MGKAQWLVAGVVAALGVAAAQAGDTGKMYITPFVGYNHLRIDRGWIYQEPQTVAFDSLQAGATIGYKAPFGLVVEVGRSSAIHANIFNNDHDYALTQSFGAIGWQATLLTFGAMMALVIPLATYLASPPAGEAAAGPAVAQQSLLQALGEAFGHRSYVLLVLGFFTCGFQLAYVTSHFQIYLTDKGLAPWVGAGALALIGMFNIVGSLSAGWASARMPKRYILSAIYLSRSLVTIVFLLLPASPASVFMYAAVTGLLWLSTVPPTSALVGLMFGQRYFAMLYGFAFFSHQVGGFLGVWLAGRVFDQTGSYDLVWYLSIALGVVSALINLPIVEQPVARPAAAAA